MKIPFISAIIDKDKKTKELKRLEDEKHKETMKKLNKLGSEDITTRLARAMGILK